MTRDSTTSHLTAVPHVFSYSGVSDENSVVKRERDRCSLIFATSDMSALIPTQTTKSSTVHNHLRRETTNCPQGPQHKSKKKAHQKKCKPLTFAAAGMISSLGGFPLSTEVEFEAWEATVRSRAAPALGLPSLRALDAIASRASLASSSSSSSAYSCSDTGVDIHGGGVKIVGRTRTSDLCGKPYQVLSCQEQTEQDGKMGRTRKGSMSGRRTKNKIGTKKIGPTTSPLANDGVLSNR